MQDVHANLHPYCIHNELHNKSLGSKVRRTLNSFLTLLRCPWCRRNTRTVNVRGKGCIFTVSMRNGHEKLLGLGLCVQTYQESCKFDKM
jgi:hypothetical protein